jgi:hypothetical protein
MLLIANLRDGEDKNVIPMATNEKFRGLTNPPLQSSRILPNLIMPCNRCTLKKLFLNLFLRKVMVSQNQFVDKVLVTENNSKHKVVYNLGITWGWKKCLSGLVPGKMGLTFELE